MVLLRIVIFVNLSEVMSDIFYEWILALFL